MNQSLFVNSPSEDIWTFDESLFDSRCEQPIGVYTIVDSQEQFSRFNCSLSHGLIRVNSLENHETLGIMNIRNCFMKILKQTNIGGKVLLGIRFIKNQYYEDIYSDQKQQLSLLYQTLKKYCLLTQFFKFYSVKELIGEGNFSKVYRAEKKSTFHQAAIKYYEKQVYSGEGVEKKGLLNEISILRALNHPNIISLNAIYEGDNHVYCVFEYCSGSSLKNYLHKNHRPPLQTTLEIATQLFQALAYLSSRNIIHRDVKPENIMFRESFSNKLLLSDFGFATKVDRQKELFWRCGTPGYVAPEILSDQTYDCKVDVYSAGVIFYQMLCGEAPFYSSNYEEMLALNRKSQISYKVMHKLNVDPWIVHLL